MTRSKRNTCECSLRNDEVNSKEDELVDEPKFIDNTWRFLKT